MASCRAWRGWFSGWALVVALLVFGARATWSQAPSAEIAEGEPQVPAAAPWEAESLDKAALTASLDEAKRQLEGLPADAKPESVEARTRAALERRVTLLAELVGVVDERASLAARREGLPARTADLEKRSKELTEAGAPAVPEAPTSEGADALKGRLDAESKTLDTLTQEAAARTKRASEIPATRNAANERATAAASARDQFATELAAASDAAEKALLTLRVGNAGINGRVAKETLAQLDEEVALEGEASVVREQAVDVQRRAVERLREEYSIYQKALEEQLARQQEEAEAEAERKRQEAEAAATPSARFLADLEQGIAESKARRAAIDTRSSSVSALIVEQEKRLQAETERLSTLKSLVERVGTAGYGGDRLKAAYLRVRALRRNPEVLMGPSIRADLEADRARRFDLDEQIFSARAEYDRALAAIIDEVPEDEREAFQAKASTLRDDRRKALVDEVAALGELIADENKLQDIRVALGDLLDDVEEFILPRLFWIRDASPINLATLEAVTKEGRDLVVWAGQCVDPETLGALRDAMAGPQAILLAALLILVAPVGIGFAFRALRKLIGGDSNAAAGRVRATILVVLASAMFPAWLLLVALAARVVDWPKALDGPVERLLVHVSAFVALWLINRGFFRREGVAESRFGMHDETARALHRSVAFVLLAYLVLLVPWDLLRGAPFGQEAIPRLAYAAFSICALIPIFLLIRRSSPLIKDLQGSGPPSWLFANWTLVSSLVALVFLGTIVMDVLGYRFGAARIATAALLSLGTIIGLVALYNSIVPVVGRVVRDRKRHVTTAPGETQREAARDRQEQTRKFLRTLFVLGGVLSIAAYWGINQRAINALDEIHLWRASVEPLIWVSVADVLRCILTFAVTIWVLRYLPGLYEVAVFPRIKLDPGVRYAILTISRYGLFVLGALIALGAIQLNLTQVGWLMAAVGFGLGFGMQEIFSNFVSGLILLIERPVRVGDIAKVGDILGTVTRINIRATTVTSFDRLENIIPNKDLITKTVTNWTLADKTTRLILNIGVAYGTDVDEVRSLLLELAKGQKEVLRDPEPQAFFVGHGESSLDFELRFFVGDPSLRMPLQDRLNTLINKELTKRRIEIPFPQRDVHFRVESWPKELVKALAEESAEAAESEAAPEESPRPADVEPPARSVEDEDGGASSETSRDDEPQRKSRKPRRRSD